MNIKEARKVKKIDMLGWLINDPSTGEKLFSSDPPSNSLASVLDP